MVSSLPSHIGEGSDVGRLRIPGQFINPCNKLPCVCACGGHEAGLQKTRATIRLCWESLG